MSANAVENKPKFLSSNRIGLILGLSFLLITIFLPAPGDMPVLAWRTAGVVLLPAAWWATEAIPIPVTSLLPILLFPALGIMTVKESTSSYADPIIFLLLGGFIIATGLSRWNLHRRLALNILNHVGSNPAATIMMIPIAMSLAGEIVKDKEEEHRHFILCLLLGVAYAASIGGIGTLIGSPPNAFIVGYLYQICSVCVNA